MYDSTNINDIPTSAVIVGFYTDGIYAASLVGVRARFPNALLVGISAIGTNSGVVGDIEPGCMTIAQGVAWVRMRRAAGVDPTIYCNETNAWAAVRDAFRRSGTLEPHYWCANYDGVAVLRAGQVARQYANPTLTGHHYDLSVVADSWPGVDDGLHGGSSGSLSGGFGDMTDAQISALFDNVRQHQVSDRDMILKAITDGTAAIVKAIGAVPPASGGGGLTAAQDQQLAGIVADVAEMRLRVDQALAPGR